MAALDMREFGSLDELRGSLQTYVHMYNQSPHASLSGTPPQDRFFSEPELIRRISLRYSPDMSEIYIVEADSSLTPVRLLNKQENASVKRDKVRLTGGDD